MNQNYNNPKLEEFIYIFRIYLHELSHISSALHYTNENLLKLYELEPNKTEYYYHITNTNLKTLNNLLTDMHTYLGVYDSYTNVEKEEFQIDEQYLKQFDHILFPCLLSEGKKIFTKNSIPNDQKIILTTHKRLFEIFLRNISSYVCNNSYWGTKINTEIKKLPNGKISIKMIYYGDLIYKNIDISNIKNNNFNSIDVIKLSITKKIIELLNAEIEYSSEKISNMYIPFLQKVIDIKEEYDIPEALTTKIYKEMERLKVENELPLIVDTCLANYLSIEYIFDKIHKPTYKNIIEVTNY